MAVGTIVQWDAPDQVPLSGCAVGDVGAVVTVRIRPRAGAAALGPEADGTCPRVIYFPDRAPDGTGALQEVDANSLRLGKIVGQRPRTVVNSSFADKAPGYPVDLGCSFLCPHAGHFQIGGGAAVGGLPSPQDVEIVIQRPELSGTSSSVVGALDHAYDRVRYSLLGSRPSRSPTVSYVGVTGAVEIPHGARRVLITAAEGLALALPGSVATVSPLPAGTWLDLGVYAGMVGATFASNGRAIPLVVFEMELA